MNIKVNTEDLKMVERSSKETLSSEATARRRVLLKGVGKGTAVLAATVPLQTLAGQSLLTFDGLHQCSISGMQSGVHSATPNDTPRCSGYSPVYWGATTGQGSNTVLTNAWPTLPNSWDSGTKFSTIFTLTVQGNPTLLVLLKETGTTNSAQRHWLCAWLNAFWEEQHPYSLNFPYTANEVLAFSNPNHPRHAAALQFFTLFMETP